MGTIETFALLIIVLVVLVFLIIFFTFVPLGLWISSMAAGVRVSIATLVGMRIRRVAPARIINPVIKGFKAGIDVPIDKLEAHYLAGGNVDRVMNALIAAQRADIPLEFERAAAIDLAG
ncbi:MAG: flotillin-like FloA family protein, partial [Clostridia bacterium]|nr:flotillin-like FloA family protein [Clostridia bacterium]